MTIRHVEPSLWRSANRRGTGLTPRSGRVPGCHPKIEFARVRRNPLAKFLQISKPAQAGFSPPCDTCAGLRLSAPLFLPIEVPQFGMDSSVVLPQPADIAGLLLADHLAVLELPLELDDLGS